MFKKKTATRFITEDLEISFDSEEADEEYIKTVFLKTRCIGVCKLLLKNINNSSLKRKWCKKQKYAYCILQTLFLQYVKTYIKLCA